MHVWDLFVSFNDPPNAKNFSATNFFEWSVGLMMVAMAVAVAVAVTLIFPFLFAALCRCAQFTRCVFFFLLIFLWHFPKIYFNVFVSWALSESSRWYSCGCPGLFYQSFALAFPFHFHAIFGVWNESNTWRTHFEGNTFVRSSKLKKREN